MKLISRIFITTLFIGNLCFLQSCNEGSDDEIRTVKEEKQEANANNKANKINQIIYSVPSHIEMIRLVKGAGLDFDQSLLNPANNVVNYNSVKSEAFNIGVYGADLSYISIFEQSQQVLNYFSAIKTLADALGISEVITDKNIQVFESNFDNHDSLVYLVSDLYYRIDASLSESDMGYVSALVVSGGWIESLHILLINASEMKGSNKEDIKVIIADQRHSLNNIISLIKLQNEPENLGVLLEKLEKLNTLYQQLDISIETTTVIKDEKTGKVVIGGKEDIVFSDGLLEQIGNEVEKIRDYFVN